MASEVQADSDRGVGRDGPGNVVARRERPLDPVGPVRDSGHPTVLWRAKGRCDFCDHRAGGEGEKEVNARKEEVSGPRQPRMAAQKAVWLDGRGRSKMGRRRRHVGCGTECCRIDSWKIGTKMFKGQHSVRFGGLGKPVDGENCISTP